jgi:hypothetical protein
MLQEGADVRGWVREGLSLRPTWWREVASWSSERQEQWAERAAIMEMDGAMVRDAAEMTAYLITSEDGRGS